MKNYLLPILFLLTGMLLNNFNATAQSCTSCGAITGLPSTAYGCESYTLNWGYDTTGGYTFLQYNWSPITGVTDSTGISIATTSFNVGGGCNTYSLTVTGLGPNLIVNGDFEGDSLPAGFTSSYAHHCYPLIGDPGNYCITNNPHNTLYSSYTCNYFDHTIGDSAGHMMMIDGDTVANTSILSGNLSLCCKTTYQFSFWARPYSFSFAHAVIKVTIAGQIDSFTLDTGCSASWTKYTFEFTSPDCGGDTVIVAKLLDMTLVTFGNDFVIDDISLKRKCTVTDSFRLCPLSGIYGSDSVCEGATVTLFDSSSGGVWSSGNPAVATVDTMGVVTGHFSGMATITYAESGTCFTTFTVYVKPLADSGSIPPIPPFCAGTSIMMGETVGGGVWSSSNNSVATIGSSTGIVTGIVSGISTISYGVTNSCGTTYATRDITVNTAPAPITGPDSVCNGSSITLSDSVVGGVWSGMGVFIINPVTGVLSGMAAGSGMVTYTVGAGASACSVYDTITVKLSPAAITGADSVCLLSSVSFSDATPGGTWWSTNASVAIINSVTGYTTTNSADTVTIGYTLGLCTVTKILTVNPVPGPILGDSTFCTGNVLVLGNAVGGGTWTLSGTATISIHGEVTSLVAGVDTITYTLPGGCYVTQTITANLTPVPIAGSSSVCTGYTVSLSDGTPAGTWTSSDTSKATVNSSGVVRGVAAGTVNISYTLGHCFVFKTIMVNTTPAPISIVSGSTSLCVSSMLFLADTTSGGVWSSSSTYLATVSLTGTVTGVHAGFDTIRYTVGTGCYAALSITVNRLPNATISGRTNACLFATDTLRVVDSGGTFTLANFHDSIYAAFADSCVIRGVSTGVDTLFYNVTIAGCHSSSYYVINTRINPADSVNPIEQTYCAGSDAIKITAHATGSTGPYTYTWSPTTALTFNANRDTATCFGLTADTTYTITVTDYYGCYNKTGARVMVPCPSICNAGCDSQRVQALGFPAIISGTIAGGRYYVGNDITFNANSAFRSCIVAIKPGVKISVTAGRQITIDNSHLYSCSDSVMWYGFNMGTNAGLQSSSMKVNHSLIEDMSQAVYYSSPDSNTNFLFTSMGSVFNRNKTGLSISNYHYVGASTPISIYNTVFTSRDFSGYQDSSGKIYPCVWPDTSVLLKYYAADSINLHMNIENPHGKHTASGDTAFTKVGCKNGVDAYTGISLYVAGKTNSPSAFVMKLDGSGDPLYYHPSLFDNLNYGVYACQTNLKVRGCYFNYIHPNGSGAYGEGIYTYDSVPSFNYGLYVNDSGASAFNLYSNYFYSCSTAVHANNYLNVFGNYNKIYSNRTTGSPAWIGYTGYNLQHTYMTLAPHLLTGGHINYTIDHNYIVNTVFGINYNSFYDSTSTGSNVNITNNKIYGVTSYFTTGWCNTGILASNSTVGISTGTTGNINIRNNEVYKSYSGINFSNFKKRISSVTNNNIMVKDGGITSGQYGIYYANCKGDTVSKNYVKDEAVSGASVYYLYGIYGASSNNAITTCNNVQNVYYGFYFAGQTNVHTWTGNYMLNNANGLYLKKTIIGQQGNATNPSDNVWADPTAWSSVNQTFVNDSVSGGVSYYYSSLSPLYVRVGALYTPQYNNSYPYGCPHCYSCGTSLDTATGTYTQCYPDSATGGWRTTVGDENDIPVNSNINVYEFGVTQNNENKVSARSSSSVIQSPEINWITQMGIYQLLQMDSSLIDSSILLREFYTLAKHSRYKQLTDIERSITSGDFATAICLLGGLDSYTNTLIDSVSGVSMADGIEANDVVANYVAYFNVLLHYLQRDTLTSSDTSTIVILSRLCPITNGMVVHEARAFYTYLFNSIPIVSDCNEIDSTNERKMPSKDVFDAANDPKQTYQLYPNPNNGNITLTQLLLDTNPVQIEIYNAMGVKVSSLPIQFNSYWQSIKLNNPIPGLYLLHLTNSKQRTFNIRFIID